MSITAEVNHEIMTARECGNPAAYLAAVQFELTTQLQKVMIERDRLYDGPTVHWRFTDYTDNDSGGPTCEVCGEEGLKVYVRDTIQGLETYCNGCVLERYPNLVLDSVTVEPPD